jgi:hypothetical protein
MHQQPALRTTLRRGLWGRRLRRLAGASVVACAALLFTGLAPPAQAATLTTSFGGTNGAAGVMFDIAVGAEDIRITALDLNIRGTGLVNLQFWRRAGGYSGGETLAAGWTRADAVTGLQAAGQGNPTPWDVADTMFGAGTTWGLYLTVADNLTPLAYTETGTEGALAVADDGLSIFIGVGSTFPFAGTFSPRLWNGTITYEIAVPVAAAVPLPGSLAFALLCPLSFMALRACGRPGRRARSGPQRGIFTSPGGRAI